MAKLWYPFLFLARKTTWNPLSFRVLSLWLSQTKNSQPTIGLILISSGSFPASIAALFFASAALLWLRISLTKWKAPIIFPISVIATADILFFTAAATKFFTETVDCKTENWVWLCKCTNSVSIRSCLFSESVSFEIGTCPLSPNCCLIFSEASLRLICCKPIKEIGFGFFNLNSSKYSDATPSSSLVNIWFRINSKKHLVVASTSAVALCASAKGCPKRYWCNSVKVGNLNLPPLPPGSCNKDAVTSVQVSKIGSEDIGDSIPIR